MDAWRAHTYGGGEEGGKGNKREGEIENERRKRENKHASNRLAIEREERKKEKDYKRTEPKEKHKKIKEEREPGKVGSHKRQ